MIDTRIPKTGLIVTAIVVGVALALVAIAL